MIDNGLPWFAITGIIAIAVFFLGRQTVAKTDGERWGKLEATLGHMQGDISEIKTAISRNAESTKLSLRRVHERIDTHLREDHGMKVPERKEP